MKTTEHDHTLHPSASHDGHSHHGGHDADQTTGGNTGATEIEVHTTP